MHRRGGEGERALTAARRLGRAALLVVTACGLGTAVAADSDEPRCHQRPGRIGYSGTSSAYQVEGDVGALLVRKVTPASPAAVAGLEAGDLVVAIDGRPLRYGDTFELAHAVGVWRPGDVLEFTVQRREDLRTVSVTLAEPSPEWEGEYLRWVEHLEIEERPEGWAMLARLTANGPVEITFRRELSCLLRAEIRGRSTPLPLTLAAAMRIVPALDRLRPGDGLTLSVQVSGNALRADPVRLPPYLDEGDLRDTVQKTVQKDYDHIQ